MFRTMKNNEFKKWMKRSINDYALMLLNEGQYRTLEEAMTESESAFNEGLPDGLSTQHNFLLVAQNNKGENIGFIWYVKIDEEQAFIADFAVMQKYRGKGYGKAILLEFVQTMINQGVGTIILHVFESNIAARSLYEKVGFEYFNIDEAKPGSMYMKKAVKRNIDSVN